MSTVPTPALPRAVTAFGGPKIALLGEYGSGKTTAMTKLLDVGVEPCILMLDDSRRLLFQAPPGVHWHHIKPGTKGKSFDWMRRTGEALKMESSAVRAGAGIGQSEYTQLASIGTLFTDFVCQRCGQHLGNVYEWGPERALCIDGMSEMNDIFEGHHIGEKPVLAQYDYGPPQRAEMRWVRKLCLELECTLVIACHPSPKGDDRIYLPNLIGSKFAPFFGASFDEVIYCYNENAQGKESFYWDTTTKRAKTKRRMMPLGDKLPVDWAQLWDRLPSAAVNPVKVGT